MWGKTVVGWGKNFGEQKVGLDMSLVEDLVGGKKGMVVVFVAKGGGTVECQLRVMKIFSQLAHY